MQSNGASVADYDALGDRRGVQLESRIRRAKKKPANPMDSRDRLERVIGLEPTTFSLGS